MRFGQLLKYNIRNIFIETLFTKCGRETIPRPFSKRSKLSISLDQYSKVLYTFFYCLSSWGLLKVIETKLQITCFYLIPYLKLFKKITRGLELVSLSHILHDFWGKIFLLQYSITWSNFNVWLSLFRQILGNMYIAIVC